MKNFLNKFDLFFTALVTGFGFLYFTGLVAENGGLTALFDNWLLKYSIAALVVFGYYVAFYDLMKRFIKRRGVDSIEVFIVEVDKEELDEKNENKQNE